MSNISMKKSVSLALGAAFAATIATSPVQADVNPFGMSALASGYMVADAKATEGKCGGNKSVSEAECGANKASDKVSEGECGANKKAEEGKCGADKKAAAASKPIQEAKCGEAKCGGNK